MKTTYQDICLMDSDLKLLALHQLGVQKCTLCKLLIAYITLMDLEAAGPPPTYVSEMYIM